MTGDTDAALLATDAHPHPARGTTPPHNPDDPASIPNLFVYMNAQREIDWHGVVIRDEHPETAYRILVNYEAASGRLADAEHGTRQVLVLVDKNFRRVRLIAEDGFSLDPLLPSVVLGSNVDGKLEWRAMCIGEYVDKYLADRTGTELLNDAV